MKKKDLNEWAFSIVQKATGQAPAPEALTGKKADSSKGGLKGGKSRMEALTPEQRSELGRKAAIAKREKAARMIETNAADSESVEQTPMPARRRAANR